MNETAASCHRRDCPYSRAPVLVRAGPTEEVAAATQAWIDGMNSHNKERVVALYDREAVLWGTRSATLRDKPATVSDYFKILDTVPPSYKVALDEQRIRVYGDIAINTGNYTFSELRDDRPVIRPARFTFVFLNRAGRWELLAHLRRTRGMRRSRHHTQKTRIHGRIVDAISISERPAGVEDRALPGHWEGDLLFGSKNSQIATLVERQSRYLMLAKVASKDTETVVNALIKHAQKLPHELYKSLTWDRGKEMADHQRFTLVTDIKVYFCDPQSPWQRGSNENTNGLLRQYLPKGIDLSTYSQSKLNAIARRLNERPRKTLNFETPAQRFHQSVASTG